MDKRPKKELIDGLRDSLRHYEERYDRAEWEHFQQQRHARRRKPIPLVVKLAGIAASLFLMVYASVQVLPLLNNGDDAGKRAPSEAPHLPKDGNRLLRPDSLDVDSATQAVEQDTPPEAPGEAMVRESSSMPRVEATPPGGADGVHETDGTSAHEHRREHAAPAVVNRAKRMDVIQKVPRGRVIGTIRRPMHRQPNRPAPLDLPRWRPGIDFNGIDVGFNITPALTNKGFSLGGGVSAQLPLSNRLSVEVAVSYVKLTVGQDNEADPTDTINLQVVGIRNRIGAVAVPVSLNYAISENFAASFGLMPFRVVRGQHTDILQRYRWVHNGDAAPGGRLMTERTHMKRPDSLYVGNTYLGFLQLSGRYSPPILRQSNLVLAPFVAFPVGKLRDDDHRWLHGGVSVRWYMR